MKKNMPEDFVTPLPKPKLTKAERRTLQEQQRAAKAARKSRESTERAGQPVHSVPVSPFDKVALRNFNLSPDQEGKFSTVEIPTPRKLHSDDGAASPTSTNQAGKSRIVYLIRHGESQGQAANSRIRKADPSLIDCGLTDLGREQARAIPSKFHNPTDYDSIDWVISSPLTRALETAVLGFPDHPVLCHYDLREVGNTTIPENIPRRTKEVLEHLQCNHNISLPTKSDDTGDDSSIYTRIDLHSLRPESWPRNHDTPPKVVRRDRIRHVFEWLAQTLPDHVRDIAVVCHYHVIRAALTTPYDQANANYVNKHVHPANAAVYRCELSADGKLRLLEGQKSKDVSVEGSSSKKEMKR